MWVSRFCDCVSSFYVLQGLGRCLFPTYHSRRVLLPYVPEKVALTPPGDIKSGGAVESV